MKLIKILYYQIFRPSIMDNCLQSAYEDINALIDDLFTNLGHHGLKLTFKDLVYLFEKYDWKDIIDALEELGNYSFLKEDITIHNQLLEIINFGTAEKIDGKWDNSYFKEFIIS